MTTKKSSQKNNSSAQTSNRYKQFFIFLLFIGVSALGYQWVKNYATHQLDQKVSQALDKTVDPNEISKETTQNSLETTANKKDFASTRAVAADSEATAENGSVNNTPTENKAEAVEVKNFPPEVKPTTNDNNDLQVKITEKTEIREKVQVKEKSEYKAQAPVQKELQNSFDELTPMAAVKTAQLKKPLAREIQVPTEPYVLKNPEDKPKTVAESQQPSEVVPQKEVIPQKTELKNLDEAFFRFEVGVYNSRIDSQDKLTKEKAIFLSDLNTTLHLDFLFPVDEKFQFFGRVRYDNESYTQFKKGSKLNDPKLGLFTYGAGFDYVYSDKMRSQIFLGSGQRGFIEAVTAGVFDFVKVWTPEISADVTYDLFKNERLTMNAGVGLKGIFSAQTESVSTETGTGYIGKLNFMRKYKGLPVKMSIEYEMENVGSNLATQKRQEARLSIGVEF